jgi:hypothetical protein
MTRLNKTRSSELRENNTKETMEYQFEEQDNLHIPEEIITRFNNEGMTLGWLRITLKGQEDYKYIGKKMQEGWQFVSKEEVPEMEQTSVVRDEGRYSGAVCRGDIALGKIPTGMFEARNAYYRNKSDELMDAVNNQLMRGNNSRMPISNTSKSTITRGRQPTFQK